MSSPRDASNIGAIASSTWLQRRSLEPPTTKRWHVEVSLATHDGPATPHYDDRVDSRFHVDIYSEEWGIFFCNAGRASWIRVTDIAFVHGRDDFALLGRVAHLDRVGGLLRELEDTHGLAFRRDHALVRTNLANAERSIRQWIEAI